MKSILIIGASGLVGSRFCDLAKNIVPVMPIDEKLLDITDKESVKSFFESKSDDFDSIINFAAYTNVDEAEKERGNISGLTYKLNTLGAKYVAESAKMYRKFLVHISTDFIFPGTVDFSGPYSEDTIYPDENFDNLIGWYGLTKKWGEEEVSKAGDNVAVVRIAYPFRSDNYTIKVDWARKLLIMYNENKMYPLFTDQMYSILYIDELLKPLLKIIQDKKRGVFHVVSRDTANTYEVAKYLLEAYFGNKVDIKKGSMKEYLGTGGRTPRPRLGGLKVEKTEKELGLKLPTWKEMIDKYVKNIVKI